MQAVVKEGDRVEIDYIGRLESGEVFDQSSEGNALSFVAGSQDIIKGVSRAVIGMKTGDQKTVTLDPEEAYGAHRSELVMTVSKTEAPPGVKVGQELTARTQEGVDVALVVTRVDEEWVTFDANHPLAGKVLIFEITLKAWKANA